MAKTGLESVVKAEKMRTLNPGRLLCRIIFAALLATPRLRNKLIASPGPRDVAPAGPLLKIQWRRMER